MLKLDGSTTKHFYDLFYAIVSAIDVTALCWYTQLREVL